MAMDGIMKKKDWRFGALLGVTLFVALLWGWNVVGVSSPSKSEIAQPPEAGMKSDVISQPPEDLTVSLIDLSPGTQEKAFENSTMYTKARLLREELLLWRSGPMPETVKKMVAMCDTGEVADALLPNREKSEGEPLAVIDIGANIGWPATKLGLMRYYDYVFSVEPKGSNVQILKDLETSVIPADANTKFFLTHGAAAREPGQMTMTFDKGRNDVGCIDCDLSRGDKNSLYREEVEVTTVDKMLREATEVPESTRIQLFKSDTQGFELEVMNGARELLASKRVNFLMVEFSVKLLGSRETAIELLTMLNHEYGMDCTHLGFSFKHPEENESLRQGLDYYPLIPLSGDANTIAKFYDEVEVLDAYTDLFCANK